VQQSAVPELAHTHTRPIHWVATAAAVAGVTALSSLVQSSQATAAQPDHRETKAAHAAPAPGTDGIDFPITCGPVKAVVQKKATGDLDGDGNPETIAVVHCDAPMGTPPDGIYVITRAADKGTPRVVATLLAPKAGNTVTDLAVRDGAVQATLLGYSSQDVPRCCPDVKDDAKWQWKNGSFERSQPAATHSV
jgi:hypothetical protein